MGKSGLGWVLAAGLLMGGFGLEAVAQPVPDETLGNERSQVRGLNSTIDLIEGGATRGQNLFHSFREFNIDAGREAYFIHQLGIENIFSRVTGETRSEINGILGISGVENGAFVGSNANLFFINPNGIVFGPNARLDVGGSFVATTANGIQFGEQGFFSATNPEAPSQLLSVDPSAFFFNQLPTGSIVNRSIVPSVPGGNFSVGLRVPNGENLLLLGGNVSVEGGRLSAFEGRVEVGAVGEGGSVALNPNGSLSFPADLVRADVSFTDGALVDVRFNTGGEIQVTGRNITVSDSILLAGIFANSGAIGSQAGNLRLDATANINLTDGSRVANDVGSDAVGNAGNLEIATGSLSITEGSQLSARRFGLGNAGNVTINANRVILSGRDTGGFPSAIFTRVDFESAGNAGSIQISTNSLSLEDGAVLDASTLGVGNIGSIIINARGNVSLAGESRIFNGVRENGIGNGGDILVAADSLVLSDGAQISAATLGRGNAGNVNVQVTGKVRIFGTGSDGSSSGIFSDVGTTGVGSGGDLSFQAGSLEVVDGGQISAAIRGLGNAGDVNVQVINTVLISGISSDNQFNSGIFSGVFEGAIGNGGSLTFEAGSLEVRDRGQISVATLGQGEAGDIFVNVSDRTILDGESSSISSSVGATAAGNGGSLTFNADQLSITNGAQVTASTSGRGNSGNVRVAVRDRAILEGESSGIFSSVNSGGVGFGGNLEFTTGSLAITNGAEVSASTSGRGDAGSIQIQTLDSVSLSNGSISAAVDLGGIGRGGEVDILTRSLNLNDRSQITTSTAGQGRSGEISLQAEDVSLTNRSQITSSVEPEALGSARRIVLRTSRLSLRGNSQISAATSGQGDAGEIIIRGTDNVFLSNSSISTDVNVNAVGQGGDVSIRGDSSIDLTNRARISASTRGRGEAGSIFFQAEELNLSDGGQLLSFTESNSRAGDITLNLNDTVTLRGSNSGIFANTTRTSTGNGGAIRLTSADLFLTDRAEVSAQSLGTGRGGSVDLMSANEFKMRDADISADAIRSTGGTVSVTADAIRLYGDSDIRTNSQTGNGGNINLEANSIVALDDSDFFAFSSDARGGNINIDSSAFFVPGNFPINTELSNSDNNNRVDIDATGQIAATGLVFIESAFSQLPDNPVNTEQLLANSCIARNSETGTFIITGPGGLPQRPGSIAPSTYPTAPVRSIPDETSDRLWQPGDPIVEPQGAYQLEDGRWVLSRECR